MYYLHAPRTVRHAFFNLIQRAPTLHWSQATILIFGRRKLLGVNLIVTLHCACMRSSRA